MIELKCKNCGASLKSSNGIFFCEYCHSKFVTKEANLPSNRNCTIRDGLLVKYNGSDKIVVIPDNVYIIGPNAFLGNRIIEKVVFSDTVHTIENNAFEGCDSLNEIINYNNVKFFKRECLKNTALKEVTIGSEVKELGEGCFMNNNALTSVYYYPQKNFKLRYTFAKCPNLKNVKMDKKYFFPSFTSSENVKNNPNRGRPTFQDAFWNTPYMLSVQNEYMEKYKEGICPDCGGKIKKGLLHAKCDSCGIDYKN